MLQAPMSRAAAPLAAPPSSVALFVAAAITAAGGGLLIASVMWHWGALGIVLGVALVVTGSVRLFVASVRGCEAHDIRCPSCLANGLCAVDLDRAAVAACQRCGTYSFRTRQGEPRAMPVDHIAAKPIFEAPLPRGDIQWGSGCVVCSSTPCELERLPSDGVVQPVRAPVCHLHRGADAGLVGRRGGARGSVIRFRSHRAARRFRGLNRS
jgi:hypothetical protein